MVISYNKPGLRYSWWVGTIAFQGGINLFHKSTTVKNIFLHVLSRIIPVFFFRWEGPGVQLLKYRRTKPLFQVKVSIDKSIAEIEATWKNSEMIVIITLFCPYM